MNDTICCFLVDDDPDDLEIFVMTMEAISKNVKCLTANDGAAAMSFLNSNESLIPHYIFLDVNMPKMNGIECLKNIKAIERLKDCKIFMYSTTSEDDMVIKAKELGVTDFIIKPARASELKTVLSKFFSN